MKRLVLLLAGVLVGQSAIAQEPSADRYGILPNPDLYKQSTPKDALASVILAIERERYDYLAAHLLPKDYIDARLRKSATYFEKAAAEQIAATGQGANLKGAELQARVKSKAEQLGFKYLTDAMGKKLADEPDNLKTLYRFLREGKIDEAADAATVTVAGVKDRTIFLRKVDGRWFFENRREEPVKE